MLVKSPGKKYRLLLGDFIEDKKMLPIKDWDKTIFIGFLNNEIGQNLKVYRENFDIVLTKNDASFDVVINLLDI